MLGDSSESLLDTPIPVLSNCLILQQLEAERIVIEPFEADNLAATNYHLLPHRIRFHVEDEDGFLLPDKVIQLREGETWDISPGEYAVVSPREQIVLTEGFVADFYPSSWCIENNLLLTLGRLDAGYQRDLVFGVFNAGRTNVRLTRNFQLARVTFGWLGRDNIPAYGDLPPGAYIPQIESLRKREAELNSAEDELRRKKEEIEIAREELRRRMTALNDKDKS